MTWKDENAEPQPRGKVTRVEKTPALSDGDAILAAEAARKAARKAPTPPDPLKAVAAALDDNKESKQDREVEKIQAMLRANELKESAALYREYEDLDRTNRDW